MAIVNLLTSRADRGATLSEIATALGQSKPTLVHVLASLAAGGFVVRQPTDRRYHLGPALIAPGQVASGRFPGLGAVHAAAATLSASIGYPVLAFARDGEHARLVDSAWDPTRPAPALRIGDLLPIVPPLGAVFVAWGEEGERDVWFARAATGHDALRSRLDVARSQGFVVELRPPPQLLHEMAHLWNRGQQMRRAERIRPGVRGLEEYLAPPLTARASYEVSTISVPVIVGGAVDLALNLFGFDAPASGATLRRLGTSARAAADRLGAALASSAVGG